MIALSKLHNKKYILKQLKKRNMMNIVCKIDKIYSVNFIEEKNSYCIVCDALKINTNKMLKEVKMYINKNFDINDKIKKYIEKNCIV